MYNPELYLGGPHLILGLKMYFCSTCPKQRSRVHVDFAAGHAVCRACGLVLRNIVFDEAGGNVVKTRRMMDRLQPVSVAAAARTETATILAAPLTTAAQRRTKASYITTMGRNNRTTTSLKLSKRKISLASRWMGPAVDCVQNCSGRAHVSSRTSVRAQNIIEQYLGTSKGRRFVSKRNVEALGVVAVYIACREQKCARTVSEVCTVMDIKENDFKREYKAIVKTLRLRVRAASPVEFLGRFCHVLKWEKLRVETRAQQFIENTPPDGGIAPAAVAAAALFLAATSEDQLTHNKVTAKAKTKAKAKAKARVTGSNLLKKKRTRITGKLRQSFSNTITTSAMAKTLKVSLSQVNKACEYICSFRKQFTKVESKIVNLN